MGRSNRVRYIVRLTQMLRRWKTRSLTSSSSPSSSSSVTGRSVPSDVPPGHVAVCVGSNYRRFVVRATHLNHPVLRKVLEEVEEEYGFDCADGPLFIPCDESDFEEAIRVANRSDTPPSRCRVVTDSIPLLCGVSETTLC